MCISLILSLSCYQLFFLCILQNFCPVGFIGNGQWCHKIFKVPIPVTQAEMSMVCQNFARNVHAVAIETQQEQDYITSLLANYGENQQSFESTFHLVTIVHSIHTKTISIKATSFNINKDM